ncbi:MAG: hypothetical protein WC400_00170 [Patescibacteria group bacterium]|jgi:hypothetical protein
MNGRSEQPPSDEYDIGELGPPRDLDDEELTPDYEALYPLETAPTTPVSEIRAPGVPEFLNGEPFRHRMRTVIDIQSVDNCVVVLPRSEFNQALADYNLPLFRDELLLPGNEGLFWEHFRSTSKIGKHFLPPYFEGRKIDWPEPNDPQTELSFIINHLPATDRDQVERAIAADKRVTVSLIWGPKDKITRFNKRKIAHYQYPQPAPEDHDRAINQERGFYGANYLAFTKIQVEHDQAGNIRITEDLLAEANIGSKTGNYTQRDRQGNVVGKVDRTLPGLISGNLSGEEYLPPEHYLYNHCTDLVDEVPTEDKLWVRRHFIEWIKQNLDREYKVSHHWQPHFSFDSMGELSVSQRNGSKIKYPKALRINVHMDGYLAHILMDLSKHDHAERRLEKYKLFESQYYPIFRRIFTEHGPEGLSKTILTNKEVAHYVLKRSRDQQLRNLSYLVYFFATDKELPDGPSFTAGLSTAEAIMSALETEYNRQAKGDNPQALDISTADWVATLRKVKEMLRPHYFSRRSDAHWLGELLVSEPTLFYHPRMQPPQPNYVGVGKKFKRWVKPAPNLAIRCQRPKKIWAFDILPPETTIGEHRDELARLFVEYVDQIDKEGMLPNTYALHRDREPRIIQGQEVDGNYFYNRGRVLWRDINTQEGQSSQYAIKRLFSHALTLLSRYTTDPTEQQRLRKLLDYESMSQISGELKHVTGKMGETFTLLAIETSLAKLLGIGELPDQLTYSIRFADIDHRYGDGVKAVTGLNRLIKQKENIIPDFIIDLRDHATGESVSLLVDSKAYLKPITKDTAQNIVEHYQPLLDRGQKLIVVSHSPLSTINQQAIEVFAKSGVILCSGEDVARVLDTVSTERYQIPAGSNAKTLGEFYAGFSRHPGGFAAHVVKGSFVNQVYLNIYLHILKTGGSPTLTDLYYETDLT